MNKRAEILKAQKDNSLTVNYNRWMFDTISPYIGSRIMDVGAGRGNFTGYLLDKEIVISIEILDEFIECLHRAYGNYKNIHILKCDIQDEAVIQMTRQYNVDTVICNNVLEHVEGDLPALNNIYKILNGKGKLVLILPAFRCLYSVWDKAVGHFRRYDLKDIQEKLRQARFSIQGNFYMNFMGFFGWFLNGRVLRNTPATGCFIEEQAVFFDRYIVNCLRKVEAVFRPPFGQSLVIVATPL
jgi:SAM-dependent methyltransferase